jgi:hypothetical protein
LTIVEAARIKAISTPVILKALRRGAFTTTHLLGRRVIVNDRLFQAWEPDRVRQRATLRGLRARRGKQTEGDGGS